MAPTGESAKRQFRRQARQNYLDSINILQPGETSTAAPNTAQRANSFPLNDRSKTSNHLASDTDNNSSTSTTTESNNSEIESEVTNQASQTASFKEGLKNWALKHRVPNNATTDLLRLLRNHQAFSNLPNDSRTLLCTPRYSTVKELTPGHYISFDWISTLTKLVPTWEGDELLLQINMDGVPLFRSSNKQLWPILGSVTGTALVFTIGIYLGNSKPASVKEYLASFIDSFLENPIITTNNRNVRLKISAFICDAPARAYITGIKGHNGYYGCAKCVTRGTRVDSRMTFPETDAELRTDESFREMEVAHHHNEETPLLKLPINMVDDIPYEYMHLVCLGVMRKMLYLWTSAKQKSPAKLQHHHIEEINTRLEQVRRHTPCEFARKARSLKELDHWKATELRQFLLYSGPVVLKGILSNDNYRHFLTLSVAVRILVNSYQFKTYNSYASELLIYFVRHFPRVFGNHHLSYNVHGLVHLSRDSKIHGHLDKFSAFKFENHLQKLKQLVRSPFNALQQLHNRIVELEAHNFPESKTKRGFASQITGTVGTQNRKTFFRSYSTVGFSVKITRGNNIVKLSSGKVVKVTELFKDERGESLFAFREFKKATSLFNSPCDSSLVNIQLVSNIGKQDKVLSISSISEKIFLLPSGFDWVAVSLVHNLE